MTKINKSISLILMLIMVLGLFSSCGSDAEISFETKDDLKEATIGIVTGTSWDLVAKQSFPDAKRKYFKSSADVILALEQGKVDAFFADKTVYAGIKWDNDTIDAIDEPLEMISNALIFAKDGYNAALLDEVNTFVAKCKEDGTLDRLAEKWFSDTEPDEHPDYTTLSGDRGTLKIAIGDSMKPTAYQRGTMYTGYEVDFITLFAEEYGYRLDIEGMSFDALIPYVSTGKCDIGACGITITEERMKSVTFSDSHFETYGVAVVRNNKSEITSIEEVADGKVAILTGSVWDGVAKDDFPQAERKYYSSVADMFLSLEQGKVDAIFGDRTFYASAAWNGKPVAVLDETIGYISCGFMLSKEGYDPVLLEELNEFINIAKNDGTVDRLFQKWYSDTEPTDYSDYSSLSGSKGTLKIAVDSTLRPMTYQKNDFFTGFDVELLTEFAYRYGYRLEIEGMTFDSLIPYVSSGKCDLAAGCVAITDERSENVTFTDPYVNVDGVVLVKDSDTTEDEKSFFELIKNNFKKTFITEDRWKLIIDGILVTLIISVFSVILGSILSIGLFMLSRSDIGWLSSATKKVAKVYSRIIAGTPVVVILMILYYVVFGSIKDMSGVIVAIIGFALTFGSFVYDHMTTSVGSVNIGQNEAAYALGYTKNKTFFRIILPQAMKVFMPSYRAQTIELIKSTAVVGYIAVNDLTKVGDVIRSNTYEPFFPLISTAIIYFIITWGVSILLGMVSKRFDAERRREKDILKGVNTK